MGDVATSVRDRYDRWVAVYDHDGKPRADAVRFLAHDLHQPLPFPAGAFDLVVSGLLDLFFREARRVLRPSGRAVVSAMHPAMFLRGVQVRFSDPTSGELVEVESITRPVRLNMQQVNPPTVTSRGSEPGVAGRDERTGST